MSTNRVAVSRWRLCEAVLLNILLNEGDEVVYPDLADTKGVVRVPYRIKPERDLLTRLRQFFRQLP